MEDVTRLFSLCACMLVGCYVAGAIPLAFSLSERRLRMVSVLGAGLLVGTALAVIIPEGVHALYEQQHGHVVGHEGHSHRHLHEAKSLVQDTHVKTTHKDIHSLSQHVHKVEPDVFIGLSLCFGFIFMLLIDHISGGHSHGSAPDVEGSNRQKHGKLTTTIGLVVHAAADGIALGAAASTSKTDVELIIFLAIMLHKAPAAFGLTTFLLLEGMERNRIRRHLVVFAAAAPVMAFVTFFGLGQQGKEMFTSVNGTGIAMLFSAGTFLYVATVHVLPEVGSHTDSNEQSKGSVSSKGDLILMVVGICAPLLLSQTHSH